MKKTYLFRVLFYIIGLLVLALGITLNTKVGLGVSPIISVSYSISSIWNWNFGNMTLILYGIFVLVEMGLHILRNRRYQKSGGEVLNHANQINLKLVLFMDFLQFPLSLVFTRFLNLFGDFIPEFEITYAGSFLGSFAGRVVFLLIAIILTGIGAAMSLNMRIVPNPGDGIVQAISDCIKKSVGFTKNCFDVLNISVTIIVGLAFAGSLIGIGIGTVVAVIGVGRVIAVFNHFCMEKMITAAGVEG
ncbi:hypothetical protein NDGK_00959 [Clostridiales bacterium CHKCI001]|nr:hypothetical protein NDGK_00959 [Clostridiales bacterium CHKCI001]